MHPKYLKISEVSPKRSKRKYSPGVEAPGWRPGKDSFSNQRLRLSISPPPKVDDRSEINRQTVYSDKTLPKTRSLPKLEKYPLVKQKISTKIPQPFPLPKKIDIGVDQIQTLHRERSNPRSIIHSQQRSINKEGKNDRSNSIVQYSTVAKGNYTIQNLQLAQQHKPVIQKSKPWKVENPRLGRSAQMQQSTSVSNLHSSINSPSPTARLAKQMVTKVNIGKMPYQKPDTLIGLFQLQSETQEISQDDTIYMISKPGSPSITPNFTKAKVPRIVLNNDQQPNSSWFNYSSINMSPQEESKNSSIYKNNTTKRGKKLKTKGKRKKSRDGKNNRRSKSIISLRPGTMNLSYAVQRFGDRLSQNNHSRRHSDCDIHKIKHTTILQEFIEAFRNNRIDDEMDAENFLQSKEQLDDVNLEKIQINANDTEAHHHKSLSVGFDYEIPLWELLESVFEQDLPQQMSEEQRRRIRKVRISQSSKHNRKQRFGSEDLRRTKYNRNQKLKRSQSQMQNQFDLQGIASPWEAQTTRTEKEASQPHQVEDFDMQPRNRSLTVDDSNGPREYIEKFREDQRRSLSVNISPEEKAPGRRHSIIGYVVRKGKKNQEQEQDFAQIAAEYKKQIHDSAEKAKNPSSEGDLDGRPRRSSTFNNILRNPQIESEQEFNKPLESKYTDVSHERRMSKTLSSFNQQNTQKAGPSDVDMIIRAKARARARQAKIAEERAKEREKLQTIQEQEPKKTQEQIFKDQIWQSFKNEGKTPMEVLVNNLAKSFMHQFWQMQQQHIISEKNRRASELPKPASFQSTRPRSVTRATIVGAHAINSAVFQRPNLTVARSPRPVASPQKVSFTGLVSRAASQETPLFSSPIYSIPESQAEQYLSPPSTAGLSPLKVYMNSAEGVSVDYSTVVPINVKEGVKDFPVAGSLAKIIFNNYKAREIRETRKQRKNKVPHVVAAELEEKAFEEIQKQYEEQRQEKLQRPSPESKTYESYAEQLSSELDIDGPIESGILSLFDNIKDIYAITHAKAREDTKMKYIATKVDIKDILAKAMMQPDFGFINFKRDYNMNMSELPIEPDTENAQHEIRKNRFLAESESLKDLKSDIVCQIHADEMIPAERKAWVMDKFHRGRYRMENIEGRKNQPVRPIIKKKFEKPTLTNLTQSKITAALSKQDLTKHSKSFLSSAQARSPKSEISSLSNPPPKGSQEYLERVYLRLKDKGGDSRFSVKNHSKERLNKSVQREMSIMNKFKT